MVRLFNGQQPSQNAARLEAWKAIIPDIKPFVDADDAEYDAWQDLSAQFQTADFLPEPLIAVVHFSGFANIGEEIPKWNRAIRPNLYVLLFSGGGLTERDVEGALRSGAQSGLGGTGFLGGEFPASMNQAVLRHGIERLGAIPAEKRTEFQTEFNRLIEAANGAASDSVGDLLAWILTQISGVKVAAVSEQRSGEAFDELAAHLKILGRRVSSDCWSSVRPEERLVCAKKLLELYCEPL